MRTSILDYLRAILLLSAVAGGAVAAVWLGVAPLSSAWCGDYHVLIDLAAGLLAYGILSGLAVRLLVALRPLRAGDYDMDAPEFSLWKQLTILYLLGRWALAPFSTTFTAPLILRLFGARIGPNAAIGGLVGDPFLVDIGPGAVLGAGSLVVATVIADGRITIAPVRIGAGATIGMNAMVLAGADIGERATLAAGAMAMMRSTIPAGEIWRGNPARKWTTAPVITSLSA